MDTEKKVQFVALTKEEIDAMIQQAALAGAQVASDAMMVGQRKSEKEKIDRRLHNTDLLLRNYRTLKASYENAVYKSKEGEVTEVLEDIMTMKDDTLIYDPSMGRYDIRFGIESYYGGLHCGDCFDVKVRDVWIPVRIEMDENWYLVGLSKTRLGGLTVRM